MSSKATSTIGKISELHVEIDSIRTSLNYFLPSSNDGMSSLSISSAQFPKDEIANQYLKKVDECERGAGVP
jgi:hypothetical protein